MRVLFSLTLLVYFTSASCAQAQRTSVCRIHRLILTSVDLPQVERHTITRRFQGGSYNTYFLAEFIRWKLVDVGYARAVVGAPQVTRLRANSSVCDADVRYSVHAGIQYRLNEIVFHIQTGRPVFSETQLRAQFRIKNGSIFSADLIRAGIERLQDLYASAGYLDFGAIPTYAYNNPRRTLALNVDIDQGFLAKFGRLLMEGVEPRAGIAQQLLAAWGELEGRPCNPKLLKDWLKRNSASWPRSTASQARIRCIRGSATKCDALLEFQSELSESGTKD